MGYMHIDNLSKNGSVLMFKQLWATEKVHGTSAHVRWDPDRKEIAYFSGGAKHEEFRGLFDDAFEKRFMELVDENGRDVSICVFGEAYGGKMQGMSKTYGNSLRFIVFEAKIGVRWLNFPAVQTVAGKLGLEVVPGKILPAEEDALTEYRNSPSEVAVMRGCGGNTDRYGHCPPMREGIVLRPLFEVRANDDSRIIAKYKNPEFSERKSKADTDFSADGAKRVETAKAQAAEWVTDERMRHVLDALGISDPSVEDTGKVLSAMVEDILREGSGELENTKELRRAIGASAALLFKKRIGIL